MRVGDEGEIRIDSRVPFQQARQAIKYLIDAAVELVTNCDDSYRRNDVHGGPIDIEVRRLRQSGWEFFRIRDQAEGMSPDQLNTALGYGASLSGFDEGQRVRGLWGRGLKETILAIGSGTIESVRDGQYTRVRMWWDGPTQTARWKLEQITERDEPNGTTVTVSPSEQCAIRAPTHRKFLEHLANHYALRDLWDTREGRLLTSGAPGGNLSTSESPIGFQRPTGDLVLEQAGIETPFGSASVQIWESPEPLQFNKADPASLSGFVVKSETASLDNTLMGFEADELARHFWGHVVCDGIAAHIRGGDDGLLTTTRQGLDWRHRHLREFQTVVADVIRPVIEGRRERLSSRDVANIPEPLKKSLTKLLNQLAKEELTEPGDGPGPDPGRIEDLAIRPSRGSAPPSERRSFGVYFPSAKAMYDPTLVSLDYESDSELELTPQVVSLREHPHLSTLLYGRFQVKGKREGDEAFLFASTETDVRHEDVAQFIVGKFEGKKPRNPGGGGGGFIQEIEYDNADDPQQRVQFSNGTIRIFQRFPGIQQYLPAAANTHEGKAILAELVLEAFCRQVARARLDRGDVVHVPGGEIDAFNAEVNRLLKKSMGLVHDLIVTRF